MGFSGFSFFFWVGKGCLAQQKEKGLDRRLGGKESNGSDTKFDVGRS